LYGGPYPFVQTGDIKNSGGRVTAYQQTYSEAGLAQSRIWPAGTMCITIAANIAETAILGFPACFPDSVVGFVADSSKCDVRFIEYMFRYLKRGIQHEASGSVQDNINLATLDRLLFPLPLLSEQRAIADVLGMLDDKIDVNRRMSQAMGSIARTLFQSWFVDFDPVRAKVDGFDSALPDSIANLFPTSFQDSEIGRVPAGWRVLPLSALCTVALGGDWGDDVRSDRAPLPVRCLRGVDLHALRSSGWSDAPLRYVSVSSAEKRRPTPSDVIIEASGECGRSLACSPALLSLFEERVIYSNFCRRLSTDSPEMAFFLEYLLNEAVRSGEMKAYVTGTAMPNLDVAGLLSSVFVAVPSREALQVWARLAELARRQQLSREKAALSAARDALLPPLVNGALRLRIGSNRADA
jgi:type I restriction enzyme S subunit